MKGGSKERLALGDRLVETVVTLPRQEIAEIMGLAGFEWRLVNLEHGPMGIGGAQTLVAAAADIAGALNP